MLCKGHSAMLHHCHSATQQEMWQARQAPTGTVCTHGPHQVAQNSRTKTELSSEGILIGFPLT
jgi:hypothetical protein